MECRQPRECFEPCAGESWTVDVSSISGIDPNDALVRIIDSMGRDQTPRAFWSTEELEHDATYDGELYLLIGSRSTVPAGSSVTLAARPLVPRLLPIQLNETVSETLTGTSPINAHTLTLETETLVAIDFDMGSADLQWALYDASGRIVEGDFAESLGGGGIGGGGIGGGGIGGGGIGGGGIGGGGSGAGGSGAGVTSVATRRRRPNRLSA